MNWQQVGKGIIATSLALGAAEFQSLVVNGVLSAMGRLPFCT